MEENQNTELPVNGLVVLLKENNVSEETALAISPAFTELYDLANEWNSKATEYLKDETLDPEEKAKQAKKARLALVKVRTGIDKKRKELNDADDKRIKDRNNAARVLTALVTPTEALLEEVEKKQENEEKERKAALKVERLAKLEPFNVDCTYYDLENMPDPAFDQLLENSRLLFEKKAEDERKASEEKALHERFWNRVSELTALGFLKDDTAPEYFHNKYELMVLPQSIQDFDVSTWENLVKHLKENISEKDEKAAADKKAEDDRLKAERDKAQREADLLKQQQKEKEEKHNETLARQKKLSDIHVIEDYQKLFDMDEASFNDYFTDKNSQYQAEENRKFIEKKKKERDDALKNEQEARYSLRVTQLKDLGFEFDSGDSLYKIENLDAKVSKDSITVAVENDWNTIINSVKSKIKAKREADLSPDKTKLKVWVDSLKFGDLDELGEEATRISSDIYFRYESFKKWAEEQINNLK